MTVAGPGLLGGLATGIAAVSGLEGELNRPGFTGG